jgi:hypothetical protein
MENSRPSLFLRLVALIVILLNVTFGYVYPFLPLGLEDMKTASGHYPNLFTPAAYAFAIWGLIYGAWILYALYALTPSQRRNPLHDRLSRPLILVNILAIVWVIQFSAGFLSLSQIVIFGMLGTAFWMDHRVRTGTHRGILRFPFSVFLGWMIAATLANFNALLVSNDWHGGTLGEPLWTVMLIGAALIAGAWTGFRRRDAVVPVVLAWAITAIGVKNRVVEPGVAMAAFAGALLVATSAIIIAVRSVLRPGRA